ncbi:unnamed protein product, partial [marine sediment metagenome]
MAVTWKKLAFDADLTTHTENTTTAHGAVSAATASKHVVRDASARAKFAQAGATGDVIVADANVRAPDSTLLEGSSKATVQDHTPKAHTLDSHSASRIGRDRMEWGSAKLLLGDGVGSDPTLIDMPSGAVNYCPLDWDGGNIYEMPGWAWAATAGATIMANWKYYVPIFAGQSKLYDRIAINVTTAGAGGSKARLGIYNNKV